MLEVRDVSVSFGAVPALDSVALDVAEAETVALLGPSGCGKSTLLRVIAGLQRPDSGTVSIDGRDLADVPPHRRGMGLMFQDHVLFGHRDVAANVAFGPRMQSLDPDEIERSVAEVLTLVGLPGYSGRDVATLSGGEAQRVALARSLAARPRLLMLDEPLGSLDRALRDRLVEDLPLLLRSIGLTSIHVTHDHDEAFAVADRVAVMGSGRIHRVGTPIEIWRDPGSESVARFLGHHNIVTVGERGVVAWGHLAVEAGTHVVRADAIRPRSEGSAVTVSAVVIGRRYRGDRFDLVVRTEPGGVELVVPWADAGPDEGRVHFEIDVTRLARVS